MTRESAVTTGATMDASGDQRVTAGADREWRGVLRIAERRLAEKQVGRIIFDMCFKESMARIVSACHLEVTLATAFTLSLCDRKGIKTVIEDVVHQVLGAGWTVGWQAASAAPAPEEVRRVRELPPSPPSPPRAVVAAPRAVEPTPCLAEQTPRTGDPTPALRPRTATASASRLRPVLRTSPVGRSTAYRPAPDPNVRGADGATDAEAASARYRFDNFVVGPSNQMARDWALQAAESNSATFSPLILCGSVGVGKTHLMRAVAHHVATHRPDARVCFVTCEAFTNEVVEAIKEKRMNDFRRRYQKLDYLLVDDIAFLKGKPSIQEEFHHRFEELTHRGCQIILTCDRPPRELDQMEERLLSRLASGLVADIQAPTVDMCVDILKIRAREHDLSVSHDALQYLAENYGTNVRQLEGALVRVLAVASSSGARHVDMMLARKAMGPIQPSDGTASPTLSTVMDKVCHYFRVSVPDLVGTRRERRVSAPRHVAMFLAHQVAACGCTEIATAFGGRDYSSVQHAIKKVAAQRYDPSMKADLDELSNRLGVRVP